jgi:hypothetical protein
MIRITFTHNNESGFKDVNENTTMIAMFIVGITTDTIEQAITRCIEYVHSNFGPDDFVTDVAIQIDSE